MNILDRQEQTDEHIAELKEGQREVQPEGQIQLWKEGKINRQGQI